MTSPENVRCIGVAPVIYSLWSSLRFRHLREWQATICPPSLVGGICGRNSDVSEWEFSLDVLGANGEDRWTSILLDRFKCFDLLLPKVGFGIAARLGMPTHIANAALNFYENQHKFFKLGSAFGDRVLYSNSAVQGCSMSILIVNTLYSVFANHLELVSPIVQFRSFIDDAKFWAPTRDEAQLRVAFQEVEEFDRSIGQQTNDRKTAVLAKRVRDSARFLTQVGRNFNQVQHAKSLGYTHNLLKQNRPANQNLRVRKACQTLKRIACLPVSFYMRQTHIHANAHSQWLHGTDVQAPSRKQFTSLRSAVLGCLFSKPNRMRSPFLFFATHEDVFLDPFAKWVLHVFSKLRRAVFTHPQLVVQILNRVASRRSKPKWGENGVEAVVAFLCHELEWQVEDADLFILSSHAGEKINLKHYSKTFFREELGRACRRYLLRQVPQRQDCHIGADLPDVDIFLTRFLEDTSFQQSEDFSLLKPFLDRLPPDFSYTRAIVRCLHSGSIFTGPRLQAAGLCRTDLCSECGVREDHEHLFLHCPRFSETRPIRGCEDAISWFCGIFLEVDEVRAIRCDYAPNMWFPDFPDRLHPASPVFVDGSTFFSKWAPLRTAAAAVHVADQLDFAMLLPGKDQTSQRAELYAAVLALKATSGNITLVSDCANFVSIATSLQAHGFDYDDLGALDNPDLWFCFMEELKDSNRQCVFQKVKAHVRETATAQPVSFTRGNQKADALAKACAQVEAKRKLAELQPFIFRAVDVQTHLVATLVARKDSPGIEYDSDIPCFYDAGGTKRVTLTCRCQPRIRCRGKQFLTCRGDCVSMVAGKVEALFCDCVEQGIPPEDGLILRLGVVHPALNKIITSPILVSAVFPLLLDIQPIKVGGVAVHQEVLAQMSAFVSDGRWLWGTKHSGSRCCWLLLLVDFVVSFGLHRSFVHARLSIGKAVRRFRDLMLHFLKLHGCKAEAVTGLNTLKTLGLGSNSGLTCLRRFSHPQAIWCFALRLSDKVAPKSSRKKATSSIIPDWCFLSSH